ncbi:MAG: HNH endonuclease [Nitrosotalea sp.]
MRKYTDKQFIEAVKNNYSVRNVLKTLGLAPAGGSYKTFYANVKRLDIDTSHFTGQGFLKGKTHNWAVKIPLEEVLVNGRSCTTSSLKERLVKEGLLINQCCFCGISDWLDQPLSLHLDHIDGSNTNNLITNLRLLCPNCHSQTPTYCGRNRG